MAAVVNGAAIKDVTTADFMAEVVDASFETPVIVDFWAPWCGPCKQLGPILERVVRGANGAVRMVKLNIDENPEIAQQMRIQSIPAVYAFKDGRPVDGFVGAVPESQIKAFVDRLGGGRGGPSPIDEALAMAKEAVQGGDMASAGAIYAQILQHEPEHPEAIGGLAKAMIARGELDRAREALGRAPKEIANHAEITAARAALDLAEQAQKMMGSAGKLRARIEKNPDDHDARFELATALFGSGERETAIDELLTLFRRDREWNEQAARKQLVKFFEAMGPTDPLTLSSRRRLSSLMFSRASRVRARAGSPRHPADLSAHRRLAAAARTAAAQHLRAALPGDDSRRARRRAPDRHGPAERPATGQPGWRRAEPAGLSGRLRRPRHVVFRDR